jgi:hypothetical protein
MLTLQGVRGAALHVGTGFFQDHVPLQRDTLELPEVLIDRYGAEADYHRVIRPAFDALWNSAGMARSQNFDESGRWVGPTQAVR